MDDDSPCIVLFVAGDQLSVERAIHSACGISSDERFLFVCEPQHCAWLPQLSGESIFVVEQPFNPFGKKANVLLKKLQARPLKACALIIADLGFESFRFRVFALRLPTTYFYMLGTRMSALPEPMGRTTFVLLAGATLLLRIILKIPGLDAFQQGIRSGFSNVLSGDVHISHKTIVKNSLVPRRAVHLSHKTIVKNFLVARRAVHLGILHFWINILHRTVALLARYLPSLDQPIALGLAWLARIHMFLRPSQVAPLGRELVHVIPSIGMGGVQRQLVLLLKNRSPSYNHRVVVLRSEDRFFARELSECGVGVYYLDSEEVRSDVILSPGQQTRSDRNPLFRAVTSSLPFCCEIVKLNLFLRSLNPRPDIVHCWLLFANLAGSIAARLAKVPLVMTSVRNIQSQVDYNYYDPRWQRILERATAALANVITANAPAVAKDYKAFAGARDDRLVTIPNGVDVRAVRPLSPQGRAEKRKALGMGPGDFIVGTVARLAKEKDFETYLRAVAIARTKLPALRSVIVGEGPLRAHLEAFASSLRLGDFVCFLGERKDVEELIQCFDAFLLTSIIEGMPNVVMESQLLGVPVVATEAGGTVDLIRQGETGLLAPIGDHETLASNMIRLFTEHGLSGRISLAASQQIRENYTIEQLVARTETVYRDLLGPITNQSRFHVRHSRHH
jgi:glycosyltransferase involved in cell wall biosynthesis